jgi:hypothetical protein
MAKAISQSDTMWVKKGDKMPNGSIAKKGVVVQRSTGKAVTGAVKLVTKTTRGKAGDTLSLKSGRYTKSGSGAAKNTGSASVVKKAGANPPAKKSVADSRAMSMRSNAKPAVVKAASKKTASSGYQAGSSKSDYKAKPAWYEQGGGGLAGPNSPLANWKFPSGGKGTAWSTPPKKK